MEKLTQKEVNELLKTKKLAFYMVIIGMMKVYGINTQSKRENFLSEIEDIIDNCK
jgi:hypothetical protein